MQQAVSAPRIAIIGAGFSGALLAVQLLRRFEPRARVYLIEKNPGFGRGLAYATGNPGHLLNVRAERMSALADQPDHFTDWLRARAPAEGRDPFVARGLYGSYIQDLLGNEIWQEGRGRNLFLVPDEAVGITRRGPGLEVEMRGGRRYPVDVAVLAIGNFPNEDEAAHYYGNPWSPRALEGLDPDAPVLLIGTGLSMVDTLVSLIDRGHRGPIHALSRRGLLPRRHGAAPPVPGPAPGLLGTPSMLALLRDLRSRARSGGGRRDGEWRSAVDSLRPHTQALWQALPVKEKHRFLRHLRPWWDVHRHRMAPAVADLVEGAVRDGRLVVQAGRILATLPDREGVTVHWRRRGEEDEATLRVARIIDCAGAQNDYARIDSRLVRGLLDNGMARLDEMGLGLAVTPQSAILDRRGGVSPGLYALGPVTRGTFWEITSVPDIREQCWQLAARLGALQPA